MSTGQPRAGSLDEVRAKPEGIERYLAAVAYIGRADQAAKDGREVRDAEVRRLVGEHGPAKTRDLTGMSLATVRWIVRAGS